jgi:hypothetical protein
MTGTKADALTTVEDAAEVLHMDEAELDAAISEGTLRRVKHGDDVFILGADVDRLQQQNDPKWLAKLVAGEVQEPDESGDTPRSLAQSVPRL